MPLLHLVLLFHTFLLTTVRISLITKWSHTNTSSRAEMEAFIRCMAGACSMIIKFHNISNSIIFDICTDSYDLILIQSLAWIQGWKKKGWRTKKKTKCNNNIDLLEKILLLITENHISWRHVRSHHSTKTTHEIL